MKILVLGAAGKTGREVVKAAMAAGHEVTAFVRRVDQLDPAIGLRIIIGDAENSEQVAKAAAQADAVLSALGHTSTNKSAAQTNATTALIESLAPGTKVISLTGYGVTDPKDPPIPLLGRMMNGVIALVPGDMFQDGQRHVDLLRASSLTWTVLRAPRLTTGPTTGFELGYFPLSATDSIARADVAAAMIGCLHDDSWNRQAPMIHRK
jgi:uncharacterized protein YbjT (DUF2867 family)